MSRKSYPTILALVFVLFESNLAWGLYLDIRVSAGAGQSKASSGGQTYAYAPLVNSSMAVTNYSNPLLATSITIPVILPDLAEITQLTAFGDDNYNGASITIILKKSQYSGESSSAIASVASSDVTNTWTSGAFSEEVDTTSYVYWILISIPAVLAANGDMRIWNVELQYN